MYVLLSGEPYGYVSATITQQIKQYKRSYRPFQPAQVSEITLGVLKPISAYNLKLLQIVWLFKL